MIKKMIDLPIAHYVFASGYLIDNEIAQNKWISLLIKKWVNQIDQLVSEQINKKILIRIVLKFSSWG